MEAEIPLEEEVGFQICAIYSRSFKENSVKFDTLPITAVSASLSASSRRTNTERVY